MAVWQQLQVAARCFGWRQQRQRVSGGDAPDDGAQQRRRHGQQWRRREPRWEYNDLTARGRRCQHQRGRQRRQLLQPAAATAAAARDATEQQLAHRAPSPVGNRAAPPRLVRRPPTRSFVRCSTPSTETRRLDAARQRPSHAHSMPQRPRASLRPPPAGAVARSRKPRQLPQNAHRRRRRGFRIRCCVPTRCF